jgi:hypothetical protein
VSVRRVADLRRVRAGLGGKINVENDIGPAAAQRRPIGSSDFGDVSARGRTASQVVAVDAAFIATIRGETPNTLGNNET